MRWFTRTPQSSSVPDMDPVGAFWQWWQDVMDDVERAISQGTAVQLADPIGQRVHAIHPDLAWELAPGDLAQHALVVTADGDPTLRATARRWLDAAPVATDVWEYHDLHQPGSLDNRLQIGTTDVALSDITVACQPHGSGLDVVLFHPQFGGLDAPVREQIAFLALDTALGELDTELWIDEVTTTTDPVADMVGLAELPSLVARARHAAMPDGRMGWTLLGGSTPDGPVVVACLNRLASIQAPDRTVHVATTVPYRGRTAEGLPDGNSLDQLREVEQNVSAALGEDAMLVAHSTCGGTRILHHYARRAPEPGTLDAIRGGWSDGTVEVLVEDDPHWSAVRQFRG